VKENIWTEEWWTKEGKRKLNNECTVCVYIYIYCNYEDNKNGRTGRLAQKDETKNAYKILIKRYM